MRRWALLTLVAVAAAAGLAAAAADAPAVAPPRANLRHFVCKRALDPAQRKVGIIALMRPVPGTQKLSLRFTLLSRSAAGSPFTPVRFGDLGTWRYPADPTLGQQSGDVWILNKQVADLGAPAVYRFQVTFRWLGIHDRVLTTTTRSTQTCFEPERRPDLQIVKPVAIAAVAGSTTMDRYTATIRDSGETAAGHFAVEFLPGKGGTPTLKPVAGLAPGALTHVSFVGPDCSSASPPTIVADPDNVVDDFNRTNNSVTVACPATSFRRR